MVQESHWNVGASVCFHVGDNTCMLNCSWVMGWGGDGCQRDVDGQVR